MIVLIRNLCQSLTSHQNKLVKVEIERWIIFIKLNVHRLVSIACETKRVQKVMNILKHSMLILSSRRFRICSTHCWTTCEKQPGCWP